MKTIHKEEKQMTDNPIISRAKSAYYMDPSYTTVMVEWEGEDGKLRTHTIPADPKNADYRDLQEEGWTEQVLEKQTEAYKKNASKAMNLMIHKAASELAQAMYQPQLEAKVAQINERLKQAEMDSEEAETLVKAVKKQIDNSIFDLIIENNEDKDEVFKLKLWALEQSFMEKASSEEKKALRQQPSLLACFKMINDIINK